MRGRPPCLPAFAAAVAFLVVGPVAAQQPAPGTPLLNPLAGIDPASLDGFLGRPLFSPTRRPPAPAAVASPDPPESSENTSDPPALRLIGILRMPNESVAQVVGADGTGRLSVRVGDFIDDWTVAAIDSPTLTLKQGDREFKLTIFRGGTAAAPGDPIPGAEPAEPLPNRTVRKRPHSKEDEKGFFGE